MAGAPASSVVWSASAAVATGPRPGARAAARVSPAPFAARVTGLQLAPVPGLGPGARSWTCDRARAFRARARALRPRRCGRIFRSAARPAARSGREGGGTRWGAGPAAQAHAGAASPRLGAAEAGFGRGALHGA